MNALTRPLFLLCLCLFGLTTKATIIPISSLADSGPGTLRQAMADANPGDTLQFTQAGVVRLDSQIWVMDTVTVLGLGAGQSEINGQDSTRLFEVEDGGALFLHDLTLADGNASSDFNPSLALGGAIRARGGVSATRCHFTRNRGIAGGALYLEGVNGFIFTANFTDCTFSQNRANLPFNPEEILNLGGAIYVDSRSGGDVDIVAINCTFSRNSAGKDGGAMFLLHFPGGNANFRGIHCTITDNQAGNGTGGVENSQADALFLSHCILAGNQGLSTREDVYGAISSLGYNLIGNGFLNYTPRATDSLTDDPGLGPLSLHLSPLPTHVPLCNSPARDAGAPDDTLLIDQRGYARQGKSDLGAHERVDSLDLEVLYLVDEGGNTLREVIKLACEGDTVVIREVSGTLPLQSALEIRQNLTLLNGSGDQIIFSGQNQTKLFLIHPGVRVAMQDFTFTQGQDSVRGGGAILNQGRLSLERCTLFENQSTAGGALANYATTDTAKLSLLHCTLTDNRALNFTGGAIDNRSYNSPAQLSIAHSTIASNQAFYQGGGIFHDNGPGEVSLDHVILAHNRCEEGADAYGSLTSLGHNLIESTDDLIWNPEGTDLVQVDPQLASMGRFSGLTPTLLLSPVSPAIDAGSTTTPFMLDQRGLPRQVGPRVDIGAVEYDEATSLSVAPKNSFVVRPNPLASPFQVKLHPGPAQLTLLNLQGQTLAGWTLHAEGDWQSLRLPEDYVTWPAGIYLLRATQSAGQSSLLIRLP